MSRDGLPKVVREEGPDRGREGGRDRASGRIREGEDMNDDHDV